MKENIEILKKLCITPGISGSENYSGISEKIFKLAKDINKRTHIDSYGNVISIIGNGKKKILIDAHLDEVGFMVSNNKNNIEILSIGDINFEDIDGSEAFILKNNIKGTIKKSKEKNIFQANREEDEAEIKVGDLISFKRNFKLEKDLIVATSLDDRIGCYCGLKLLKDLENIEGLTIIFTFSAGEERDKSNIDKIAIENNIDFGIIIDAAYATPVNFPTENINIPELGKGCAIQYVGKDFIVKKDIIDKIKKQAKKEEINFQIEIPQPNTGRTNFSVFQNTGKSGCVINIPVRDQHKEVSYTNINDSISALNMIKMIIEMIKKNNL